MGRWWDGGGTEVARWLDGGGTKWDGHFGGTVIGRGGTVVGRWWDTSCFSFGCIKYILYAHSKPSMADGTEEPLKSTEELQPTTVAPQTKVKVKLERQRISDGEFLAIMAAPPCSTFSIARFIHSPDSPDGGPQILRDRNHIHGLDKLSPGDRRGLDIANKITLRTIGTIALLSA